MGFGLSACIIAKNEEENIGRCLKSLAPYPFEIVVADTGSSDRTKEIAQKYTPHVYDFAWNGNFAAAKNFAVSKASNDMVFVIDCDEFIEELDWERMMAAIAAHPSAVGRILRINVLTRKNEVQRKKELLNRVFSKSHYYYEGRIHEQIEAADGGSYETYPLPLSILHTGYDLSESKRREKAERNFALLEKEFASPECREIHRPYLLYQMGKACYLKGGYEDACLFLSRGLSYDLDPRLEYVIDMTETYGYALLNSGQAQNALAFEAVYDTFGQSADFQFLMGLIYMNNAMFAEAVAEFQKALRQKECRTEGINSYAAHYNIGVIHECLGRRKKARDAYQKCGDYPPAAERLRVMEEEGGI